MQSPDARDEHVVDALLDGGALLEDPMRMALVLDELRARRAEPRPELRAAVAERLAAPAAPRRRVGLPRSRRLLYAGGVVAVSLCAIGIGSALTSGGSSPRAVDLQHAGTHLDLPVASRDTSKSAFQTATVPAATGAASPALVAASPSAGRLQDYQAWMRLRVTSTTRLSQVAQRVISLTRGFDGYVTRSDVNVQGAHNGTADLDVHIPIARVQDAIARFSSLGVIVGQHVSVADLQSSFDAATRRAESLRHSLALIEVRLADPKVTPEQRVALLAQRERARHALVGAEQTSSALTARGAYARLDLAFSTGAKAAPVVRHEDSRFSRALHRAAGILETAGIGVLYLVLLGGPVLALIGLVLLGRGMRRRRREQALLART